MKIEHLGVMRHYNYLLDPALLFAKIRYNIAYSILPERVLPLTTLLAFVSDIVHALASRTELLYAYQIMNVHFTCIGVPRILRCFKIVEYIQYSLTWWEHGLQRLRIT